MNTSEAATLYRNIRDREEYVEFLRREASDLEKRAELKWLDVQALEENLASDMARIEELEREG